MLNLIRAAQNRQMRKSFMSGECMFKQGLSLQVFIMSGEERWEVPRLYRMHVWQSLCKKGVTSKLIWIATGLLMECRIEPVSFKILFLIKLLELFVKLELGSYALFLTPFFSWQTDYFGLLYVMITTCTLFGFPLPYCALLYTFLVFNFKLPQHGYQD